MDSGLRRELVLGRRQPSSYGDGGGSSGPDTVPVVSGVGSTNLSNIGRSLPEDRGEFGLGWSDAVQGVTALIHYTAGYSNDRSGITDTTIASQTTLDLLYTRSVGEALELSLGVVNVTDRDPPLAQFTLGYDPVVADPRGRVFSIGLTRTF